MCGSSVSHVPLVWLLILGATRQQKHKKFNSDMQTNPPKFVPCGRQDNLTEL